jgi:hypothetical protein
LTADIDGREASTAPPDDDIYLRGIAANDCTPIEWPGMPHATGVSRPVPALRIPDTGDWSSARLLSDCAPLQLVCAAMINLPVDMCGTTHGVDIRHFTDFHVLKREGIARAPAVTKY